MSYGNTGHNWLYSSGKLHTCPEMLLEYFNNLPRPPLKARGATSKQNFSKNVEF